jgi:PAS domain S-box-containing protein
VNTTLRLLHLEDDEADADLVQKSLENDGVLCTVTRVDTEAAFRGSLATGGFDLILADYTLPEFDGISALNLAREMSPDVPFIFLSGTLDEEVAIHALKIGATDYVFKTRLSRIAPSVRRALREARERAELRRSEAAIRASEHALRLIVDTIPGLVATMTVAGAVEQVNQRILDYTGRTLQELQDWRLLVHPDDLSRVSARWMHSIETGHPYEIEHRILGANGVYRWFHVHGLPMLDAEGHVVRWYLLLADITERRSAEENLQRSRAFLAEAQGISRTGSFGWNVVSGEISWSEETYNIFAYDRKTTPTLASILARIHPDDRDPVQQTLDRAAGSRRDFDFEHRLLMPDGSVKHLHVVARALSDASGGLEFVGAVTDVTERKQHELLLAGEKRLLEMIATGESRPVILDALCRLVEELANGPLSSILLLDPNARCLRHGAAPSLPASYIEAIDGIAIGPTVGSCGTAAYRGEPVVVSDIVTDPLWADFRDLALTHGLRACWSTPILSSEGRVLGTFAIYYREPRTPTAYEQNIIERITHLASIAVERDQAERALRELAGRLIDAQEEERSRIGRELHDHVGQTLNVLTIAIDQLRVDSNITPGLAEALDELRRKTGDITDDVRRLSHRLHSSTLDYLGLVPALQKLVSEFSERHGIQIAFAHASMPASLPSEVALCLFRVAEESLTNIAKHSRASSAQVHVSGSGDGIRLTVQDAGDGFDAHGADGKGGLGFVSMQERLRALHGTMRVESAPAQGTRIDVWVPPTLLPSNHNDTTRRAETAWGLPDRHPIAARAPHLRTTAALPTERSSACTSSRGVVSADRSWADPPRRCSRRSSHGSAG